MRRSSLFVLPSRARSKQSEARRQPPPMAYVHTLKVAVQEQQCYAPLFPFCAAVKGEKQAERGATPTAADGVYSYVEGGGSGATMLCAAYRP